MIAADPGDAEVRAALGVLAGQLGRDGEWARELGGALATLRRRRRAAGRDPRGRDRARAGRRRAARRRADRRARVARPCSRSSPTRADAFEALTASYRARRSAGTICARCSSAAPRSRSTIACAARVLLELAALEEDVLGQPGRAAAAHRRVLELDPTYLASYQALDRLLRRRRAVEGARGAARAPGRSREDARASRSSSRTGAPSCSRTGSASRRARSICSRT